MERVVNGSVVESHFRHENVWVLVPDPEERGLRVVRSELPERWDLPPDDESFELSRRVINFEVQDAEGNTVEDFSAGVLQLRVGLTASEVRRLQAEESVKLAYAVKDAEAWVEFTAAKHNLYFDLDARDATVEIEDWGDPTLGFGR